MHCTAVPHLGHRSLILPRLLRESLLRDCDNSEHSTGCALWPDCAAQTLSRGHFKDSVTI